MRLFIAEKPSLGRAIADVLPKPHRRGEGFIACGNDQIVTWCVGHLLEQAQPDVYDSRYARWSLVDLPIIPEKWRLQPRPSVAKQLKVVEGLLAFHSPSRPLKRRISEPSPMRSTLAR